MISPTAQKETVNTSCYYCNSKDTIAVKIEVTLIDAADPWLSKKCVKCSRSIIINQNDFDAMERMGQSVDSIEEFKEIQKARKEASVCSDCKSVPVYGHDTLCPLCYYVWVQTYLPKNRLFD